MKYHLLIVIVILSSIPITKSFGQEKIKTTAEKIVTKNNDEHVKTKEKNTEFVAESDSVKIKDRHGRKKTKDYTAHTVIKEKKGIVKFKNKNDGSWMKIRNGVISNSSNYGKKKDSIF